jgi:DNA-binding GntR family transcriptional regulator
MIYKLIMKNIKYQTKSEIIYQGLKQGITNGLYRPGQRMVISKIAKEFGTSDIPVREAMKHLESDGLIKSIPCVGAVVTEISIEDMEKIYPVRIVLEGLAARAAAQHIKERDFNLLENIIKDIQISYTEKRYEKIGLLNREFHERICSASQNIYLQKSIIEMNVLCSRNPAILVLIPELVPQVNKEHKEILKALKKRDGDLAEQLVIKHKEFALENLRSYARSKELDKVSNGS